MYIKPNNNNSYLGTISTSDELDMQKLKELRHSISMMNKGECWGRHPNGIHIKKRIEVKGRGAKVKMKTPSSKGPVQYTYWGSIVGGISNAKELDVYIYNRY